MPAVIELGYHTMGDKTKAFAKGGLGCLGIFIVLAVITLLVGGSVHFDLCGGVLLFLIGGVVGLIVLAVYNRGKRDR